jgi:hypothetical protein
LDEEAGGHETNRRNSTVFRVTGGTCAESLAKDYGYDALGQNIGRWISGIVHRDGILDKTRTTTVSIE